MSEVAAVLRGARLSAQKGRLVVDSIRGKKVAEALDILSFSTTKGADLVKKVLESAIANAEHITVLTSMSCVFPPHSLMKV